MSFCSEAAFTPGKMFMKRLWLHNDKRRGGHFWPKFGVLVVSEVGQNLYSRPTCYPPLSKPI